MEQIMSYVNPELLVISVVLYFISIGFKKSKIIPDNFMPLILGGIGILLCMVWVMATSNLDSMRDVIMGIFTAFVQGILVAGVSTYVDQIFKQVHKEE